MQDMSSNGSSLNNSARPVSNIYLEPSEINVTSSPPMYDQVVSESETTANKPTNQSEDRIPLMYVGGAASAENLAASPSGASGAMSGSGSISGQRQNENDEYVEMSGEFADRSVSQNISPAAEGKDSDYVNSCDLAAGCCQASGSGEDSKFKNLYTCPMTVSDYARENGDGIFKKDGQKEKPEMHIYSNKLEDIADPVQRPLPPVPSSSTTKPWFWEINIIAMVCL